MAREYVTHACGHEQTHYLVGAQSGRKRKAAWLQTTLCSDCYYAEEQKRRDEAQRAAAEKATEYEMPALTGSEKQVAWANEIRMQTIAEMERDPATFLQSCVTRVPEDHARGLRFLREHNTSVHDAFAALERLAPEALSFVYDAVAKVTSSRAWIDGIALREVQTKMCPFVWRMLMSLVDPSGADSEERALKEAIEAHQREQARKEAEAERRRMLRIEAEKEATILVEDARSPFVVEVEISGNLITMEYPERDDGLMEIGKSMDFKWLGGGTRRLSCGADVRDRAVEVVCRLIAGRFNVLCMDSEIRERAQGADFKPKAARSVKRFVSGKFVGWFAVYWERGANLYEAAKRIRGTRWSSDARCAAVRPEMWKELLDFAEQHGIEITAGARELVEERQAMDANPNTRVKVPRQLERDALPPPAAVPQYIPPPDEIAVPGHLVDEA